MTCARQSLNKTGEINGRAAIVSGCLRNDAQPLPYDHLHFPLMLPDSICKMGFSELIKITKLSRFEIDHLFFSYDDGKGVHLI